MSMRYPGGFIASTPVTAAYPSGVWTQAQAIPYQAQNVWTQDQFWPYTTLLLQGNGTNGAQNNTFLDSSSNNFTITRNGNTTQGSFTPYEQDGYWSNYFGGSSSDYIAIADNAALDFGTGDFTIEFWFNFAVSQDRAIATGWNTSGVVNGWAVDASNTGVSFTSAVNDSYVGASQSGSILNGVWNHFAAVRSGSTLTVYLNGVGGTPVTNTQSINTQSSGMMIGRSTYNPNPRPYQGYVSNFRILKGTALYTANFTPSAAPLTAITNTSLLTCQSNRFRDNSTNNFTVTPNGASSVQAFQPFPGATTYSGTVLGGSGYFDGSGDWLNLSGGSSTAIGTGSGTVEFWMYATANDGYRRIVTSTNAGFTSGTFVARFNNGNFLVGVNGSEVTVSLPTANQWYHIAWVGTSGTSQTVYVNGVSAGTGGSYNATESINFVGGNYNSSSEFFAGYLAGVRVVKGTAVYTGAFTPPTSPPTAITNTSLLLNFTNAGIFDAAVMNDLETVGNAQVSTSVVKYGTGSMYFDGSGDWLIAPSTQQLSFGTGDFTVEMWVYATSVGGGTERFLFDTRAASADAGLAIYISTTGVLSVTSSDAVRATGGTITANSWIHVAVVRASGSITVFLNGIPGSASSYSSSITCPGSVRVGIKTDGTTPYVGYIDDLRATKGVARYLTSFTPPPARMPGQ